MNRTIKRVPKLERKDDVTAGKGDKMDLRLERIEQIYRNVKGAMSQLEILLAEEKEQAGKS